jgi:hypothetical protein
MRADTDPKPQAVRWATSGDPVMVSAEGRESLRGITMSAAQRRALTKARLDALTPDKDGDDSDE